MKVLYAASEALPFAASGGLGDVMGALPKTVNAMDGIQAEVILPFYETMKETAKREGILQAKLEMLDGLAKGSSLFLNGDNDMLSTIDTNDFEIIKFGIDSSNLYMKAEDVKFLPDGSEFTAICENESVKAFVPAVGIHNVYNALCAMCVGKKMGFTLSEAAVALKNFAPEGMRQNVREVKGYTFIEDCYNASPDSQKAGLNTLCALKGKVLCKMRKRYAAIDYIFYYEQITACDVRSYKVKGDMYLSCALRALTVGGNLHTVNFNRHGNALHQVAHKGERALQYAN
mgnify:CR=1 FL=1